MEKPAILIHISDLHFIGFLQNLRRNVASRIIGGIKPHLYHLASKLATIVEKQYVSKYGNEGIIITVTGDLTTRACIQGYEEVNNYVRGDKYTLGRDEIGLKSKQSSLVVPGNHDAWFKCWWSIYGNRKTLCSQYFRMWPDYEIKRVGKIDFVFYLIDSNRVTGLSNFLNWRNALGKGKVGKDQLSQISDYHEAILSNKANKEIPPGFDYDKSVKVALLHHHLVPPKKDNKEPRNVYLKLSDSEEVITAFQKIGIDFVLCGHKHFPYHDFIPDNRHTMFFSCAGSATQLDEKLNSFKVYEFYSDHFEMLQYQADQKVNPFEFNVLPSQSFQYPNGFSPAVH